MQDDDDEPARHPRDMDRRWLVIAAAMVALTGCGGMSAPTAASAMDGPSPSTTLTTTTPTPSATADPTPLPYVGQVVAVDLLLTQP